MLAQNFLPAKELGLTDKGLEVMIRILRMLESGELKWTPVGKPIPNGFNMGRGWETHYQGEECGTVGCIAGWFGFLGKGEHLLSGPVPYWNALVKPKGVWEGKHTVEQAAKALRSTLVTGVPDWS